MEYSLGEPVCASQVLSSSEPKAQRFQQPPKVRVSLEGHYLTVPFCQHEIKIIIKTHPADWRQYQYERRIAAQSSGKGSIRSSATALPCPLHQRATLSLRMTCTDDVFVSGDVGPCSGMRGRPAEVCLAVCLPLGGRSAHTQSWKDPGTLPVPPEGEDPVVF